MSTPSDPGPMDATAALEELGRISLQEHSMESLLQTVADLAHRVLPGRPETSVSVMVDDRPVTVVYQGELARDCDESQYGRGYGPCLEAAARGETVEIPDMRTETRWPDYARSAAERGALSSLSIPLPISEGIRGAVNVYAHRPRAFDDEAREIAGRFAPYAAVAASNLYAYESARDVAENLRLALESRATIDMAKGMLMERFALTPDLAFQVLVRVSMSTQTKVRVVADRLVRTGEIDLG
ncbi:GAF and ANTAR domain-containing protein [Blastococcus sp. SYSU D00820]